MIALYALGAILVLLLLFAVVAPLREGDPPDDDLASLPPEQRYDAALEALRALEFDHQTDKVPPEEYRELKARYGRILLDAEQEMGRARDEGGSGREGARPGGEAHLPGREADVGAARCPWCEEEVPADGRFCPRCGARQPWAQA